MNAWRTGRGISVSGSTVRRSAPSSLMRRPSAAYIFDVWTWTLPPAPWGYSREMLGQCSPAHTRVHAPYERPSRYAPASTAIAITRRRTLGFCHHERGPGSATGGGAGMDTIALQPSEGARRLPAVGGSRTIPRHVRPLGRTRLAGLRAPRHAGPRGAPRHGSPHAVLRLRPHRAQLPGREPDAADAAAAVSARRPQADCADGRRHRPDWRSQREAERATSPFRGADPGERAPPARPAGAAVRLRREGDARPRLEQSRLARGAT